MQMLEKTVPADDSYLSYGAIVCLVLVAACLSSVSYGVYMEHPATTEELQALSPCGKQKAARIVHDDLMFEPLSRSEVSSLESDCEKRAKAFAEEKEQIKKLDKQRAALGV